MKVEFLPPQLATLVDSPPAGHNWIHEAKLDGYRTLIFIKSGKVTIFTRNGHDWTRRYPGLAKEAAQLKVKEAILDGEVVALDKKGMPDFNLLQNSLQKRSAGGLLFYAFDLLWLNGKDLKKLPLLARKMKLSELLVSNESNFILYSDHFESNEPAEMLDEMCRLGLEGVISKRKDLPYHSGRSADWLKTKCVKTDEFIIIGYLRGNHHELGSLLLGAFQNGELKFVGKVGTGFSVKKKNELMKKFTPLKSKKETVSEYPDYEKIVWLRPKIVAEIEFLERTKEQLIRHGSFQRLREDKDPAEIHVPGEESEGSTSSSDHYLFEEDQITRDELKNYYRRMKKLIWPHLEGRPLNLFVCHGNIHSRCYHLRRLEKSNLADVKTIRKPNGHYLMLLEDFKGIESLLEKGAVEFHTWGAKAEKLERPDEMVFDLDAGEGVSVKEIQEAALQLKSLLEKLGLKSFIKTTGGKGYHIHVPIEPRYSWSQVKSFCETVAKKMAEDSPDSYTTSVSPAKRREKIFIDFLRNSRGATFVAPYSVRAKKGAKLAVPISWRDLAKTPPDAYGLRDAAQLLKRKNPWRDFYLQKQIIKILEI